LKEEKHDVIVIGAGPAGCAAAKILSENGAKVLLLDKFGFNKEKGCGGGLTPKAVRLLKKIFPVIQLKANPVKKLELHYGFEGHSKKVCGMLFNRPLFHVTSRSTLDRDLLKVTAESSVSFRKERVRFVRKTGELFVVETDNQSYRAEYVIIAAGVFGSRLLTDTIKQRYSNIVHYKAPKLSNAVSLIFFENGYAWYFPGLEEASIGSGVYVEGKPSFYISKENLSITPYKIPENEEYHVTPIPDFSVGFAYEVNEFVEGCLVIGDSAGLVDSWTGEGISYALYSGMLAARAVMKYRKSKLNKNYLRELRPLMENLVMATGLRNSFSRNFPEKIQLVKDKRFARLFFTYVSCFSKSVLGLALKSYLIPGHKVRID